MPTPTTYSYTISTDFPGTGVASAALDQEIQDSSIVTALDYVEISGDTCDITFKDVLSAGDKTTLDGDTAGPAGGLVAAHTATPLSGSEFAFDANGAVVTAFDGGATQIGMQAVQVLNLPDLSSDFVKSWQITAAANTTEILDIFIGDDLVGAAGKCYLAGGEYRCRNAAAEGSALNFSMIDRNDVLGIFGLYGMSRTKLSGLTFNTGVIGDVQVGDIAVGGTSSGVSQVLAIGADFLEVQFHEATFSDGENITFTRAGSPVASLDCTLGTWDEGDVIVIQESLKDEWIEGMDQRDIHPGGSKEVPEGLYFRVKLFNADLSNQLRIKVSLTVGRL